MDVRLLTILIAISMLNSTWQEFTDIINNLPNGSIVAAIVAVIAIFLLIFAGKKLTKIYELVRELDEKLQEDEAELRYHKSELNKIYKVAK